MKKISIVIPCRNEKDFISRCVTSCFNSDCDADELEVIVCDGMSNDGTREVLELLQQTFPNLKVIDNAERITPVALNLGIKAAQGDYIMILGAHAEIEKSYLQKNSRVFEEKPGVWCSGGTLENVFSDRLSENIAAAMSSQFGVGTAHFRTGTKSGYVDTVAFGLYRREVFEKAGLFDEALARNQDDEFNFRIIKQGGKIWLTNETSVKYHVRASFEKLFCQYFQYGYWKVFVNRKHHTVTTLRQLVPPVFVLYLFIGLVLSIFIPPVSILFAITLAIYFTTDFISSYARAKTITDVMQIMFANFILHFSYGLGYLKGVLDFILLSKHPSSQSEKLTR